MAFRMQLTYNEIVDILNVKYFAGSTIGYTLPPGVYKIKDINLLLKSLLPNEVKVNIKNNDTSLRSNLTTSKTIRFFKKCFFNSLLGFVESHSGPLSDIKVLFN